MIFHEKSSAKSGNVMVSPKNFTVGSTVTSDQAELQIFVHGNVFKTVSLYQSDVLRPLDMGEAKLSLYQRFIRGYCRPNKEP